MSFPQPFYRWRPHPWHGLEVGPDAPHIVHAYIEITPFDTVKYEVDKKTGYMRVDRPQRTSSYPPTLYGFIPRTFCGTDVGNLSPKASRGDGDPMDICVLTERHVTKAEVILNARVVGGLQMVDHDEADDKIIAVLDNDKVYDNIQDISDVPAVLVERLKHYFLTYKLIPGKDTNVTIDEVYGRDYAEKVIKASMEDYINEFGG
ncbi:MAG: inorganic pyrophosphatase [Deinococcales bacterium]